MSWNRSKLVFIEIPNGHLPSSSNACDQHVVRKHLQAIDWASEVFLINWSEHILSPVDCPCFDFTLESTCKNNIQSVELGKLDSFDRLSVASLVRYISIWCHNLQHHIFG